MKFTSIKTHGSESQGQGENSKGPDTLTEYFT